MKTLFIFILSLTFCYAQNSTPHQWIFKEANLEWDQNQGQLKFNQFQFQDQNYSFQLSEQSIDLLLVDQQFRLIMPHAQLGFNAHKLSEILKTKKITLDTFSTSKQWEQDFSLRLKQGFLVDTKEEILLEELQGDCLYSADLSDLLDQCLGYSQWKVGALEWEKQEKIDINKLKNFELYINDGIFEIKVKAKYFTWINANIRGSIWESEDKHSLVINISKATAGPLNIKDKLLESIKEQESDWIKVQGQLIVIRK